MSSTMSTTPTYGPGENFLDKAKRKTKEEPLVPLGVLATCVALYMATRQFKRGNRQSMNQWLRFRVAAQGFTVLVICSYGFALQARKKKNPEEAGESERDRLLAKEKADFQKRLDEAVEADRVEKLLAAKQTKEPSPNWKEVWKAGILKKNEEHEQKKKGTRSE